MISAFVGNLLVSLALGIPLGLKLSHLFFGKDITKGGITRELVKIFKHENITTPSAELPKIKNINIFNTGFTCEIDIKGICSYNDFKTHANYIKTHFHAVEIECVYNKNVLLTVLINKIDQLNYYYKEHDPYTLLCGYDGTGNAITINMKKTPHVGVVGTSTSGKSKCVELMLKNLRGAKIHLVNCFADDFLGITADRINGAEQIKSYLTHFTTLKEPFPVPHYLVIDEYNVLNNIKGVSKQIQDLLSQARHFNVYVICIMQVGNKEDCQFKNLFNTRIAFRTLEHQTLNAFLGTNIEDPSLLDREFYIVHTKLTKGKTYNIV